MTKIARLGHTIRGGRKHWHAQLARDLNNTRESA